MQEEEDTMSCARNRKHTLKSRRSGDVDSLLPMCTSAMRLICIIDRNLGPFPHLSCPIKPNKNREIIVTFMRFFKWHSSGAFTVKQKRQVCLEFQQCSGPQGITISLGNFTKRFPSFFSVLRNLHWAN